MPGWWAEGTEWGFAVEFEGRYAGTVSLRDEGPGRAEIAYGSHPDVRGTGAMLRALRLLVDWGFAELDLGDDRLAGLHRQLAEPEAGLAARGHGRGHPAPLPPPARRPARRVDRHAAQGRPARAAVDLARGSGAGGRRVPAAADHGGRRAADPRGQRGPGQPALARAQLRRRTRSTTRSSTSRGAASSRPPGSASPGRSPTPTTTGCSARSLWFNWTAGVECEVGYWTHPEARGRGLTTAAVRLVTGHVFETLGRPAGHRVRGGRQHSPHGA